MARSIATPDCIGIIMDGNRRWAKAHGRPLLKGHQEGYARLEDFLRWARDAEIPHVVAYAFSTENWHRAPEEVRHLMKLFRSILEEKKQTLIKERVRVRFVGDRARFGEDMQRLMREMEEETSHDYAVTLHLLMSYGGRAEIVAVANTLLAEGAITITEEAFAQKLWTREMPDPDLVIRTGGEKRLSNFLPWQTTYSELFFVDTFWPAFSKEEFDTVLEDFASRERRRGK